jgi:hypothetical protein
MHHRFFELMEERELAQTIISEYFTIGRIFTPATFCDLASPVWDNFGRDTAAFECRSVFSLQFRKPSQVFISKVSHETAEPGWVSQKAAIVIPMAAVIGSRSLRRDKVRIPG